MREEQKWGDGGQVYSQNLLSLLLPKRTRMKSAIALLVCIALVSFSTIRINNSWNEYMLKGNVRSITYLDYNYSSGKTLLEYKCIVDFDKNGYELSRTNYNPDTIVSITAHEYKFNSDGNKTEQTQLDGRERKPGWRTTFTYDKNKRLTETNRYSQEGDLCQKVVCKYDDNVDNAEQFSYSGDGASQYIERFKYTSQGDMVESDLRGAGDSGSVHTARFTAEGIPIAAHDEFGGTPFFTKDYTYSQVKYDKTGNWVEMMVIEKNSRSIDTTIRKRTITYY